MNSRLGNALLTATFASFTVVIATATIPPVTIGSPPDLTHLEQGWSVADRDTFYFTSQGSEMIPYDWFLSIENADNTNLFRDSLSNFGFVITPQSNKNPDRLPLGFVKDENNQNLAGIGQRTWLGLNCAACHTSVITYKKNPKDAVQSMLVLDGGQTNADFGEFVRELDKAISTTLVDSDKSDRFAHRVLGPQYNVSSKQKVLDNFKIFAGRWSEFTESSKTPVDWGPGRVDAFGMIFNRVCNLDLKRPQNNHVPDAPVSYPFLWNVVRQDHVQWHGEVANSNIFQTTGRNAGEVLGVFASVEIDPHQQFYRSTINGWGLLKLEREVSKLVAPKWPTAILGSIDSTAAERGKALYNTYCSSCHLVLTPNSPTVRIKPYPVNVIGTDPTMTVNVHTRRVETGPLYGSAQYPFGPKFGPTALASEIVGSTVVRSLFNLGGIFGITSATANITETANPGKPLLATKSLIARSYKIVQIMDLDKWGYEARPLNGIWATAPYLHNGSVPTLDQLLLPQAKRMEKFNVGTLEYDPIYVGYQTDASYGGKVFDTTLPGNRNTGHNYGVNLSEAQRKDLLEYLKTL
jgi:hypothetical protein